jgi:general secretion pathway protein I
MKQTPSGFTLIEVLLALAVIAIALTALLKATSENTSFTNRLKEKSIKHWVAMQGVASIQLGLVPLNVNQQSTQTASMLGRTWYWRALVTSTPVKHMNKIRIEVSESRDAGFSDALIAYRYVP